MTRSLLAAAILVGLTVAHPGAAAAAADRPECLTRFAESDWTWSHQLDFPAGFWSSGDHRYDIRAVQPGFGPIVLSRTFTASDTAPLHRGEVLLRVGAGPLETPDGPAALLNPAQDTAFFTFWISAPDWSRGDAVAYAEGTSVELRWDGGPWVALGRTPVVSMCAWRNAARFHRDYRPDFVAP